MCQFIKYYRGSLMAQDWISVEQYCPHLALKGTAWPSYTQATHTETVRPVIQRKTMLQWSKSQATIIYIYD